MVLKNIEMNNITYYVALAVLFLVSGPCFSQQVVSSAGTSAAGTNVQTSWTIGEPVIETFTGTSVILTQGFHQSRLIITALEKIDTPFLELSVYPNPFFSQVHIAIVKGEWQDLQYAVYSIDGKLLKQKMDLNQVETLNCESYAPGVYFLNVTRNRKEIVGKFKLIKN